MVPQGLFDASAEPITTAGGLVFIGATLDAGCRAFDVQTGRELWKHRLPAGGKATPMTYPGADGRQYVVISAGGDGKSWGKADSIMAFALPKGQPREHSCREDSW